MSESATSVSRYWMHLGTRFLPFADAASPTLPLARLMRLSLFQVSVGMAMVLLTGTLNRVMILELKIPAGVVALMVSLPLVFAPLRALIGFKSDTHKSVLGWRRVPYMWFGTLLQFGGLAIMPFALIVLSGDADGPEFVGVAAAALSFLLVGAGVHTTQTAGLALATDLAEERDRPRVVAFLYVMLLAGMVGSALALGQLLADFSQLRLIQVVQGTAVVTFVLNVVALWQQEARDPERWRRAAPDQGFSAAWATLRTSGRSARLLTAVGLGSAAFSMQDILLEPYGGEVLSLSVGATTMLTALLAGGSLAGFALAARWSSRGVNPCRSAGVGAAIGLAAFAAIILAAPTGSGALFRVGTILIGLGGGLFSVGTLAAAMELARTSSSGIALGAWGAVQATSAGVALLIGGVMRDGIGALAARGALGPALDAPAVAYGFVYLIEIILIFAALVALGPLSGPTAFVNGGEKRRFGLSQLPG